MIGRHCHPDGVVARITIDGIGAVAAGQRVIAAPPNVSKLEMISPKAVEVTLLPAVLWVWRLTVTPSNAVEIAQSVDAIATIHRVGPTPPRIRSLPVPPVMMSFLFDPVRVLAKEALP